ncbi:MAG: hypothetical protein KC800_23560, partial [Candidatus Eremiobacteraeota bacterium]|nr:hypothetical protein [Candidatus Eremiobacteraeota bacterium]
MISTQNSFRFQQACFPRAPYSVNTCMLQLMQCFLQLMDRFSSHGLEQPCYALSRPRFGQPSGHINPGQSFNEFFGPPGFENVAPGFNHANAGTGGGQRAVDVARQFVGERSWDIKGRMPFFRRAGGLNLNCADFVSAALQNAGLLGGHEVNVTKLEKRLIREGWVRIPAEQAGPGDVAITPSRGHVELCQGNGRTIGSN